MRHQLPERLFHFDFQKAGGARDVIEKWGAVPLEVMRHLERHGRESGDLLEAGRRRFEKRIEILAHKKGDRRVARRGEDPFRSARGRRLRRGVFVVCRAWFEPSPCDHAGKAKMLEIRGIIGVDTRRQYLLLPGGGGQLQTL